jgi:hypothetical protein
VELCFLSMKRIPAPTILIRMHGRMVGTPADAFASDGFAHPTRL